MASTYSNLKIQLMATGENSGTWGNVTNVNLGTAIEEAIAGSADVTFSSGNVTLTLTDTNASQTARNMRLNLTGTTGGARDLIVPAIEKMYVVNNGCADAVTVKVSGQTGVAVPAGKTIILYNNGTDVVNAITHLSSLTLGSALPVASGGTGSTTGTFSGANITTLNASNISSGTLAVARGGTGAASLAAAGIPELSADQTFSGANRGTVTTDNDGSFDMNATNNFKCTPTGTFTLTFTNITSGQSGFILLVNSGGYTVSAAATTKVSTTALATISAAGTYLLSYFSDGTNVYVVNSGALA